MAYRETDKVRSRKAQTFDKILVAALYVVAEQGFNSVQMADLAKRAGVATGTLYRYFSFQRSFMHRSVSARYRRGGQ